jgi:MscS family membrane protein
MLQRNRATGRLLIAVIAALWAVAFGFATPARSQATEAYPTDTVIDRSTPEACLSFFIKATNEIRDKMEFFKKKREETDSWIYPQPSEEERKRIDYLMAQILDTMDLSAVPEWSRETIGTETAFMIREILRLSRVDATTPLRRLKDDLWVVPGTYLQIGEIQNGMRMGDVVVTADTVANVPGYYQKIISKKPKQEFNTYKFYTESPGGIIPPAWSGGLFKLPDFWLSSYGTNTIWQWTLFGVALVVVFVAPTLLGRLFPGGDLRIMVVALLTMLFAKVSNYVVIDLGSLTATGALVGSILFSIAFYVALALAAFMMSEIAAQNYTRISHLDPHNIDSSIVRLLCRVAGVFAALGIILYGLSTAGFPVMGIVAGLGVGGLAFALAAKPTLENLLAGVVIYMDKSVKVGDDIEAKDIEGVVEEIGMRSTRLRAPDGSLISVTNSELSDKIIRNRTRSRAQPESPASSQES